MFERTNSIGWKLRMRAGSKRAQEGMTLIEVLVALLILSVGLLGAAAIQLNALKYTDSSRMTSQASFIAYDMMDRIRANSGADYTVTPPTSGNPERRPRSGPLRLHHQHRQLRSAPPRRAASPSISGCTPSPLPGTTRGQPTLPDSPAQFCPDQSCCRRPGDDAVNRVSKGFGLIELLIALALSLIVVLGVVQIFIAAKNTYLSQNAAASMQEDARFVLSKMIQEIRMVGMFGCLGTITDASDGGEFQCRQISADQLGQRQASN